MDPKLVENLKHLLKVKRSFVVIIPIILKKY